MSWSKNAMTSQRARTTTSWTPRLSLSQDSGMGGSSDSHQMNLNRPSTSKATAEKGTTKDKTDGN